jgi:hypothetical protein
LSGERRCGERRNEDRIDRRAGRGTPDRAGIGERRDGARAAIGVRRSTRNDGSSGILVSHDERIDDRIRSQPWFTSVTPLALRQTRQRHAARLSPLDPVFRPTARRSPLDPVLPPHSTHLDLASYT